MVNLQKVHHTELEQSAVEVPVIVDMSLYKCRHKPRRMPDLSYESHTFGTRMECNYRCLS